VFFSKLLGLDCVRTCLRLISDEFGFIFYNPVDSPSFVVLFWMMRKSVTVSCLNKSSFVKFEIIMDSIEDSRGIRLGEQ